MDDIQLDHLAHEFVELLRHGERPKIEDYARRHPELADEIHDLFPLLISMEGQLEPSESAAPSLSPSGYGQLPEKLADYRILGEAGRGGMGVVYEAIQESLGRRVALKVLPAHHLSDPRQVERFRREARAVARLHHTNIVPVFDVGETEGFHYYSMQFIEGRPLNELLSGATIDPAVDAPGESVRAGRPSRLSEALRSSLRAQHYRQVAMIGRQAADALAYAHDQGVLHRDVKPANLLLDLHGIVWLMDFGLVRMEGLDELTAPGDLLGTLRYLPPERFEGQVDERGDIYSLGVTLYELLTSTPAFAASTRAGLVESILRCSPPPPRRSDPLIPRDLETVVLKAMAREPAQRYATADALRTDLENFLADRPVLARRTSLGQHAWRWCRRNKALASLIALALVLLTAIALISSLYSARLQDQLAGTRAAQHEARKQLFDSLLVQAHAAWNSGKAGQRFDALRALQTAKEIAAELQLPADARDRLRTETIGALCLPDLEIDLEVDAWPRDTLLVDFDPSFERYARADVEGNVTVHRVSDHRVLHQLPNPGPAMRVVPSVGLSFSPDGQFLQQRCYRDDGRQGSLRLWDLSAAEPRVVLDQLAGVVGGPCAYRADGRQLAAVTVDLPLSGPAAPDAPAWAHVYDTASGRECALPVAVDRTARLALCPTLPQLAVSDSTAVRILDLKAGTEANRWERPDTTQLAWSPDGRQLLAASDADRLIQRWDATRGQSLPPLEGHPRTDYWLTFNRRGDLIVSNDVSGDLRLWDAWSGRLLLRIPARGLTTMRFSADDRRFAATAGLIPKLRWLRMASGGELRRFPLDSPETQCFTRAALHPNGPIVATASRAGVVLWDVVRSERLAVIPGYRHPLSFTRDGTLITCNRLPEGVASWLVAADPEHPERLTVGASRQLVQENGENVVFRHWSTSADGRVIAMPNENRGANVFLMKSTDGSPTERYQKVVLGPQYDVRHTAVSPDGQWVVTGSLSFAGALSPEQVSVTIWESATGKRIKDLLAGPGDPCFSPDGAWLVVLSGEYSGGAALWRVGSWEPGTTIWPIAQPGGVTDVAFDPPRRLFAVQGNRIRLVNLDTGRIVAWLSVPEETSLAPQCFTPDGTRLIAIGQQSDQLYVWDLRAIRQQLAALGLDWDSPPFDPPQADALPAAFTVHVEMSSPHFGP